MNGDIILVWQNGQSTVLCEGAFFHGVDRPELSFPYDSLVCESPSGVYFRMVGETQFLLTEEQVAECAEYARAFREKGNYAVFAYDPGDENVYKGRMSRLKAEENGFQWTIDVRPDRDACAWNGSGWTYFHAALTSSGELRTDIPGICGDFGVLMTKEEFEAFPKQPHRFYVWDFVKEEWRDRRPLAEVRKAYVLDLRHKFEAVRWKSYGHFVPQYEQASWRIQVEEARAWLADRTVPTPYLDAFMKECPKTDRETFARTILRNHRRFAEAMGRINGIQTAYFDRIMAAGTAMECDAILAEAAKRIDSVIWLGGEM